MSKSITIQEGGVGKTLTNVKKLKTAKQGGGSVFWVPEEEVQLKTKHISKNGTYKASSDNAYGYSQVTVSGIGKATGIKPGSGTPISEGGNGKDNEYAYVTPQGGGGGSDDNIIEKLLPSSIKIITPPSQTEYTDGEDISISGMVITAYNNDGTVWTDQDHPSGHVELSEIIFEPQKADKSKSKEGTATSDLWPTPIYVGDYKIMIQRENEETEIFEYWTNDADAVSASFITENERGCSQLLATKNQGAKAYSRRPEGGDDGWNGDNFTRVTYDNKTVYYKARYGGYASKMKAISPRATPYNGDTYSKAAWTIVYGTISGGGQEITVTWKRPEDEKELSDKFSITVNPDVSGGGGTDSGGGSW